jgi:hypothetical protein
VEQDVLAFFAQHDIVDRVADGPKAVNIMTRSNGRPSGQAVVQMREPADAEIAMQVLHGQWMGSRYIEVFLLNSDEEAGKTAASSEKEPTLPATSAGSPTSGAPPQLSQASATSSLGGPTPDLSNPFAGAMAGMPGMAMPGMPPPAWQLGLWNAMANNLAPPLGGPDFSGSSEPSSWEALFEFLGPEGTAAQLAAAGQLPPLDYGLPMGYPGLGIPPVAPNGFPQGTSEGTTDLSGLPTTSGTTAAATV